MTTWGTPDPRDIGTREPDAEPTLEHGVVKSKNAIILRRFLRNRTAVLGLCMFGFLCVFAAFGGLLSPWDSRTIDPLAVSQGPSAEHWFGTSQSGRDLYMQMVDGVRTSIVIGLIVGLGSALLAAVYGCTMAYFGGRVEKYMLLFLETLIMVPTILIVAIATSGGGGLKENVPGWILLTAVLLLFGWMGAARLIRSLGLSLMTREFIKAAQFMGVHPFKIVWRHLVPNIGSLLVLEVTKGISLAVLAEISFSFVGIGVKDPDISLGVLIAQASSQVSSFPWMFWFPLAAMFFLTGALAMMNDGLRDAFDPHSTSVGKAKP
ncbi:ABC transporter permease [Zafaria sp. Z1313]|uniref:ABC transporter permease n=1 Tax=Zafaria sp. Z1313 TaxID=3423202 RepID=UPI003D303050